MKLTVRSESWAFATPFKISRGEMTALDVIVVELTDERGVVGRGEAAGVDYEGETIALMLRQVEGVQSLLTASTSQADLLTLLPRGGARNAIDCALWDLKAKASGIPAWQSARLVQPRSVITVCTIGIGPDDEVRSKARALRRWPMLKLKMDAEQHIDLARIVHEEAPDAQLICDANQAWTVDTLNRIAPMLAACGTVLIEQPLPKGEDQALKYYDRIVPLAADESCTDRTSVAPLVDLYDCVNIKLDKAGGLTEAFAVADEARRHGMSVMVGCMAGTSLAMAPGFLVAQGASYVDLDGPLLHASDRPGAIRYDKGVMCPFGSELWGGGTDTLGNAEGAVSINAGAALQ
jgi:L-Ala-D/L-Glu epimerase